MTAEANTVGIHWCDLPRIPKKLAKRRDLHWWVYYPDELGTDWQLRNCAEYLPHCNFELSGNQLWPSVWATHTVKQMRYSIEPNSSPSKHYTILNRKPRPHRVEIMSALMHTGVLSRNHYSWSAERYDYSGSAEIAVCTLDSQMADEADMWCPPALQFADSAASVVLESNDDEIFVTEKTFIPLYQRRLPLVYAAEGFYNRLLGWGFEFPREINFNWDSISCVHTRRRYFIDELHRLETRYTPVELARLYTPYAQHNRETLFALAELVPDSYVQWRRTVQLRWAETAVLFIRQIEGPACINTL